MSSYLILPQNSRRRVFKANLFWQHFKQPLQMSRTQALVLAIMGPPQSRPKSARMGHERRGYDDEFLWSRVFARNSRVRLVGRAIFWESNLNLTVQLRLNFDSFCYSEIIALPTSFQIKNFKLHIFVSRLKYAVLKLFLTFLAFTRNITQFWIFYFYLTITRS